MQMFHYLLLHKKKNLQAILARKFQFETEGEKRGFLVSFLQNLAVLSKKIQNT